MRRFSSIDWKLPALMSGIVILITAMLVRLAYVQFTGVLYDSSGRQMRASSSMVASLMSSSAEARRARLLQIAADEAIERFLRTGAGDEAAMAAILRVQGAAADSQRSRMELLGPDGTSLLTLRSPSVMARADWASARVATGSLRDVDAEISPILDVQGIPHYQLVTPVRARAPGLVTTPLRGLVEFRRGSVVGYVVETRALSGRALDALHDMAGTGVLLLGTKDGPWTDFERLRPPPVPIAAYDTAYRFADSPRGAGLGVAQRVSGTPWVVWLERPHTRVIGPVSDFVARAAPLAIAVALLGVLLAWVFGRRITHRIVLLTRQVDALEADPAHPEAAPHREVDEIAHLEHAFTRMAERVETQQQLEAQLRQSQKLEAIGRLAGGIAHDFNNVLTVISNYGELVQSELVPGSAPAHDMDQVLAAAERASRLTRQLLAFSRHQLISPQRLDLNELIDGAHRMLSRLIPSNIELVTELDPHLAPINADPGQIDQVLFNLILNAADAMPDGGRITVRTLMANLDETFTPGEAGAPSGPQVCLVVRDTGVGMDRATRARIFEPFFTTKPLGEGTGLGLPTVHGIVMQSGGRLWVSSEPGEGTTFKIFLPALTETEVPAGLSESTAAARESPSARGTILLVEDDASTREVTRRLLERQGFHVLQAERGAAALETLETLEALDHGAARVDLVLSDVMMPGMSGVDLAETITGRWPRLPVLLMSGYSDVDVRRANRPGREIALIEKPFTAASLFGAIRDAMDGTG